MTELADQATPKPERPTLKTVARLSGLAVTTVSRALGDAPDINADTKRRVREIADEIGYVPNRAGVRLRTGRTNVIALVLAAEKEVLNMSPRLIGAIAAELADTRYHLIVVPELPGQAPIDPVRYIVETRSADAVILNRIAPEDPRVAYLQKRGFPFASHGRTVWQSSHAWFDYDNTAFARTAVQTLVGRGRRSIVLIAPPSDQAYGNDIIDAAQSQARESGIALHLTRCTSDDLATAIEDELVSCLADGGGFDGVVAASPHAAMAAVGPFERAGHVIGDSVDIYSKETFPILDRFRPGILSLREDIELAGRFLAKAAIHEIKTGGRDPMQALDRPDGLVWMSEAREGPADLAAGRSAAG